MGSKGIVASTAALAVLLQEGIGDTIRISLTPEPHGKREKEVIVAQEILQTMGLRQFTPQVIACPGCGRTTSTVFQELASDIQNYLRAQMPAWKDVYAGVESMNVAVMGCVVTMQTIVRQIEAKLLHPFNILFVQLVQQPHAFVGPYAAHCNKKQQ